MRTVGAIRPRNMGGKFYRWEIYDGLKWARLCAPSCTREEAEEHAKKYIDDHALLTTEDMNDEKMERLVKSYLQAVACKIKPHTLANKSFQLQQFVGKFGETRYKALNGARVRDWIEQEERWGTGGKRQVCQNIKACVQWFVDRDHLTENKLARVKFPAAKPRKVEYAMTAETYDKLLNKSPNWLKTFIMMLWETGARPGELLTATAKEFYEGPPRLEKAEHKTKHKGCQRYIRLSPIASDIVKDAIAKYPTGQLFRGRDGGKCSVGYITRRLKEIAVDVGLPDDEIQYVCCYGFRHSFATRLLQKGKPSSLVASALGHTTTKLVETVYGHVADLARMSKDLFS